MQRPDLVVPFAFAVFSAAGVAPLVISNPMNMIVAVYAGIGFNEYAARMAPIALAGRGAAYFLLCDRFTQPAGRSRELGTLCRGRRGDYATDFGVVARTPDS
jgi:Na+/H+ antiporter NhaD/arsenite permease-like protein